MSPLSRYGSNPPVSFTLSQYSRSGVSFQPRRGSTRQMEASLSRECLGRELSSLERVTRELVFGRERATVKSAVYDGISRQRRTAEVSLHRTRYATSTD
jgi:hypothetical protein